MLTQGKQDFEVYILGGFNGWECLREVEKIDLSHHEPRFEQLKSLSHPIKNGQCFFRDDYIYLVGGWDEKET